MDFFLSETAELADIVLPGNVWAEDEGTTTSLEGRVIKYNKAVDPPGEARLDWQIVCELARRLGKGQYFDFHSSREIFDELRLCTRGAKSDYWGITYEKIAEQNGVFWPCPAEDHPGTPRLYEQRFGFPDGKARFHPIAYIPASGRTRRGVSPGAHHRARHLSLPFREPDAADAVPAGDGPVSLGGDARTYRRAAWDQGRRVGDGTDQAGRDDGASPRGALHSPRYPLHPVSLRTHAGGESTDESGAGADDEDSGV